MATPCTPERAPQRTCGPLGSPGLYERMATQAGTFDPFRGYVGCNINDWDARMVDVMLWMQPTIPENRAVRNMAPGGLSRRLQADNAQSARAAEIEAFKRRCVEQRNQRQMEQQRQLAARITRVQQARRSRTIPMTQCYQNTFAEESCDDGSYDDEEEDDDAGLSMSEEEDFEEPPVCQQICRPQQPTRQQSAMAAKKAEISAFKRQCDLQKQQRQALQAQQLRENQERVARARAARCQRRAVPEPNCRPRGGYDADATDSLTDALYMLNQASESPGYTDVLSDVTETRAGREDDDEFSCAGEVEDYANPYAAEAEFGYMTRENDQARRQFKRGMQNARYRGLPSIAEISETDLSYDDDYQADAQDYFPYEYVDEPQAFAQEAYENQFYPQTPMLKTTNYLPRRLFEDQASRYSYDDSLSDTLPGDYQDPYESFEFEGGFMPSQASTPKRSRSPSPASTPKRSRSSIMSPEFYQPSEPIASRQPTTVAEVMQMYGNSSNLHQHLQNLFKAQERPPPVSEDIDQCAGDEYVPENSYSFSMQESGGDPEIGGGGFFDLTELQDITEPPLPRRKTQPCPTRKQKAQMALAARKSEVDAFRRKCIAEKMQRRQLEEDQLRAKRERVAQARQAQAARRSSMQGYQSCA